jgi:predicted enzyme related to lactoylglutathione lyase
MSTASQPATDTTATAPTKLGRFVWYDLMTTDLPAATSFYRQVAGWGTQDFDMGPAGTYQMWTANGTPIGGGMPMPPEKTPPGAPPHWLAYVSVPNVDETLKQAVALGATVVHEPQDIPTVGRFAILNDPQGAMIALYTSLQGGPDGEYAPKVGEFSWHELITTDHKAAFDFYSKLFGWSKISEFDMGPMGVYLMYGHADAPPSVNGQPPAYGGMMTKTPDMPMPPSWVFYIRVGSADEAAEKAKSLGAQVIIPPMDVPGGDRVAMLVDPQGATIAVHSMKKA